MLPAVIVHAVGAVMNPLDGPVAVIVQVPVPVKPLPVMVTSCPLGPLGGDNEIDCALTGI